MSEVPPAAYGTISLIGRDGKDCACAAHAAAQAMMANSSFIGIGPRRDCECTKTSKLGGSQGEGMKLKLLLAGVLAVLVPAAFAPALAQYPAKPIKVIIPFV